MMFGRRSFILAAAACALIPAGTSARTVRLRIDEDRIFMPVIVNGQATEAILDSAAEMTVIGLDFANRLGLDGGKKVIARGTGAATTGARLVTGVTLGAAGLTLRPETVAVIDLGDISRRLQHGRPINVILGRDLFDAARLAIDIEGGTLDIVPRAATPPGRRVPLTMRRGIETLPVLVEGHAAAADFDLGNGGRTLIGAAFAARHGLLGDGRATGRIGGGGIGGETQQTTLGLRRLDLAGRRFEAIDAVIDTNPDASDANVGVALLRRFYIVTDFAHRAVWLKPR